MADSLAKRANELRSKGDSTGAVALLRQHLKSHPNDLISQHNLAAALGDIGNAAESAKVIGRAITAGLNKPQSWLVYARALSGIAQFEQAQQAYLSVLATEPTNVEAHRELAQLLWMTSDDFATALKYLNQAIDNYPQALNMQILRSELAGQMGDVGKQHEWMEACYQGSAKDPAMAFFLSKAALANRDFKQALAHGQRAAKAFSNDLQCRIHFINCLLATGHVQEALTNVESVRLQYPIDQHLIALLGTCWRLLGDQRYGELFDYDAFVKQIPLGVPKGWRDLAAYIDDLERELDQEHHFKTHPFNLSVRGGSQIPSITASVWPAMAAYSDAVSAPVKEYLGSIKGNSGPLAQRNTGAAKLFSAWSVKLFSQGYHVNHVHQEGWLSSACHIRHGKPDTADKTQEDKAGWFKLGQPGPVTVPEMPADKYIEPRRGHIVIFPSYVWHGTVPFSGDTARLTVAADLTPG